MCDVLHVSLEGVGGAPALCAARDGVPRRGAQRVGVQEGARARTAAEPVASAPGARYVPKEVIGKRRRRRKVVDECGAAVLEAPLDQVVRAVRSGAPCVLGVLSQRDRHVVREREGEVAIRVEERLDAVPPLAATPASERASDQERLCTRGQGCGIVCCKLRGRHPRYAGRSAWVGQERFELRLARREAASGAIVLDGAAKHLEAASVCVA